MPWYRAGTVAVTLNSNTVTGAGTSFVGNTRVGDAFIGPDGGWYEVTNVPSNTVLAISPNYRGATAAAGTYSIVPVQGYTRDLADQAKKMLNDWGDTLASLGAVATEDIVPVAKGGTGSSTATGARTNLGLGSAATATSGMSVGNLPFAERLGYATSVLAKGWLDDRVQGFDPFIYGPGSANMPSGGTGYWYKQTLTYNGSNRLMIAWPYGTPGSTGTIKMRSVFDGVLTPEIELYHTGNTTRGSGGVISAASPIVRIASVTRTERRDLHEQTFESAGEWGVANSEAPGVFVERISVGEYRVVGSLGLALEGWRTQDPCSPDGGRTLGITDSRQDADGTVTISLFKQRWTLSDDGEMVPGRGAPMDVPLNSWIDVRLEMPKVEMPPPTAATEE